MSSHGKAGRQAGSCWSMRVYHGRLAFDMLWPTSARVMQASLGPRTASSWRDRRAESGPAGGRGKESGLCVAPARVYVRDEEERGSGRWRGTGQYLRASQTALLGSG